MLEKDNIFLFVFYLYVVNYKIKFYDISYVIIGNVSPRILFCIEFDIYWPHDSKLEAAGLSKVLAGKTK